MPPNFEIGRFPCGFVRIIARGCRPVLVLVNQQITRKKNE
jgi:hypothetical protein